VIAYDRAALVDVLVHHWPTLTAGCLCGWHALGHSFPEHVADAYEQTRPEQPLPGEWVRAFDDLVRAQQQAEHEREELRSQLAQLDLANQTLSAQNTGLAEDVERLREQVAAERWAKQTIATEYERLTLADKLRQRLASGGKAPEA
jgi:hypothetical protein